MVVSGRSDNLGFGSMDQVGQQAVQVELLRVVRQVDRLPEIKFRFVAIGTGLGDMDYHLRDTRFIHRRF